jgi:hypothetical protein
MELVIGFSLELVSTINGARAVVVSVGVASMIGGAMEFALELVL